MKILKLLFICLILNSCNIYEIAGEETESILLEYTKINPTPSIFRNGSYSNPEYIILDMDQGRFNTGINTGDFSVYDNCGGGYNIVNISYLTPSRISFDLNETAPTGIYCEVHIQIFDSGYTPNHKTEQTQVSTRIILEP